MSVPVPACRNMRCVCTHWFDTAGRSIAVLRPTSLPVLDLVEAFPSLKVLDLSNCTKVGVLAIETHIRVGEGACKLGSLSCP